MPPNTRFIDYPWAPLYMVERSGQPEVVVFGIAAVVTADNGKGQSAADATRSSSAAAKGSGAEANRLLIETGDSSYKLWTRSLLKPWQLLSHFRILRESYPSLTPPQLALMTSSHSAEKMHLDLLEQIMEIGKITPHHLQCPPTFPLSSESKEEIKKAGLGPSPLYHNCSGKHCSYLLSLQAQGLPLGNYLSDDHPEHRRLEHVLCEALGVSETTFQRTTDGCQLPNQNLSVKQMATLYRQIACATAKVDATDLQSLNGRDTGNDIGYIGRLMHCYPQVIGGTGRLDTRIMSGTFTAGSTDRFIAKGGADGLLAIGILPNDRFESGVGIVIKLAAGNDNRLMEIIAAEILRRLGVHIEQSRVTSPHERTEHLQASFFGDIKDRLVASI